MSDSSSHYQQLSNDEEVRKYPDPTPAATGSHVKRDITVSVPDTERSIDKETEKAMKRAIEIALERSHEYHDLIKAAIERVNREVIEILLSIRIYPDPLNQVESTDET
jgi:hypothetical protein